MRALIEIDYLNSDSYVEAINAQGTSAGCNVSHVDRLAAIDNSFNGFRGFHFAGVRGEWPAITNGTYHYYPDDGYSGFCSKTLSDVDGNTNVTIVFSIGGGNVPTFFSIEFDKACNEYAKEFIIRNNQNANIIHVNGVRWRTLINIEALAITADALLTVEIVKWNKPFKNVKISKISFGFTGQYTDNELENFKCSEQLFDTQFKIQTGILEQYADIKFVDRYGEFQDLAVMGFLADNSDVRIYALDGADDARTLLGTYKTDKWDIKGTNNKISLSCKDITRTFENIPTGAVDIKTRNVDELLKVCFSYAPGILWGYIDSDTKTYCQSISTPDSWLYRGNLKDTLEKVCKLGMLRCYWFIDRLIFARCY